LYADNRVLEAAAVGVPDKRLGELPTAIVTLKKGKEGTVQEKELIKTAESM
jgi:acyl-CoA synthetase (AMP-forming)/AMP-acid ligase II